MVATWVLTTIFSASTSSRCRRGPIARSIAGNGHPWESGERNEQFIAGQGADGHGCRRVADAVTAFDGRPGRPGLALLFSVGGIGLHALYSFTVAASSERIQCSVLCHLASSGNDVQRSL